MKESTNQDRWMVSYADFITVLFAFFVVLFASAYQENHSIKKVSNAIHYGFVDLESFSSTANDAGTVHSQVLTSRSASTHSMEDTKAGTSDETAAVGIDIEELRRQLEAAIGRELKDGQVTMSVTPEGFVISLKDLGFFDSGQAVLRPGAADKIERIAKVLAQHGFYLRVEGHSDDQPIHTAQFDSNWELSTARAMAVLTLLINQSGLDPGRISLAGYGQYRPIADNATAEGRRMNRRVDLVVVGGVKPRQPQ
ncbi:MAG: OmpA family protein [Acidobacteriaceae bacterium]|jgi:chemotaxis protein MotB